MKSVKGQSTENTFEVLGFDILTNNEMNEVRGGGRPQSKDKDVFDTEDE
jgi:hypothetical protein